jgi:hypothetical protein
MFIILKNIFKIFYIFFLINEKILIYLVFIYEILDYLLLLN